MDQSMEMFEDAYFAQPLVGSPAPDFKSNAYCKGWEDAKNPMGFKEVSLSDYKGKWLVLFFFPLAFSGPCGTEIGAFNSSINEFTNRKAEVLGCSIDSGYALKGWLDTGIFGDVAFPLLADLTKDISANYGVLIRAGIALRSTVIINPEGEVRHFSVNPPEVGRNVDEVLRLLDALQSGGFCPANWKKGDKTLG